MTSRKGGKFNFIGRSPNFNYIPNEDRYLVDIREPKYKFNVIGTGANGCEHIRVTMAEGRASIYGIYDPNPGSIEKAKEAFKRYAPQQDLVVYESLEDTINEEAVDGLIISTPNYTHIDVLKVAIQSGKHIFLEKPMATTVPDAYEIMKIAEDYPAVLQIGLQYRYKAMYVETIHEALERRSLGDLKVIGIVKHRIPFLDKVKQWNKFSKFSGGTLVEKCCHYFDMLNMFAQSRPVKVYATGSMEVAYTDFEYGGEQSDILDNALVSIEYANGVRASFNLCMFAPLFYEEVTLCGDEGHLRAYERHEFMQAARPSAQMEVHLGVAKPSRISIPVYPTFVQESGHSGATFFEHIDLIDNIEGLQTDAATAEEGFWSVVVGAAAEESVKTGQPVMIDEFLKANGITGL